MNDDLLIRNINEPSFTNSFARQEAAMHARRTPRPAPPALPLDGRVAVVAGATRGAGRGIARALGEAGAVVYCTGRSVAGNPSPYGRPETVDETADLINRAGGTAVAVRVDHTNESEVQALFERIDREHGRLDVVADSVAGEDPLMRQWGFFWKTDFTNADAALRQGLVSHMITAKCAAPFMMARRRGLIVEVSENDVLSAGGNPLAQAVKAGLKLLALTMAGELRNHGVAAVSITPGFLRSEAMLEHFKVTEATWRDGAKTDSNFLQSESPWFVGRAVAALAADPHVLKRTGRLFSSWQLAREYGFTDADGRRPDWGAHTPDFSTLPPWLVDLLRTGAALQRAWLDDLSLRTRGYIRLWARAARIARTERADRTHRPRTTRTTRTPERSRRTGASRARARRRKRG
jgi:NAD(P)-dependent dehydrogenase (short-subunit alcohol dehydrogenase family)